MSNSDKQPWDLNGKKVLPVWFWLVSIIALLWFLMDMSAFFMRVTVTEEARMMMTEKQKYLHRDYPLWVNIVFAFEVFGGVLAALALLLKRRLALLLFSLSLLGVLSQSIFIYFISDAVAVLGMPAILMPLLSIGIGVLMIVFSQRAISRQWLRQGSHYFSYNHSYTGRQQWLIILLPTSVATPRLPRKRVNNIWPAINAGWQTWAMRR